MSSPSCRSGGLIHPDHNRRRALSGLHQQRATLRAPVPAGRRARRLPDASRGAARSYGVRMCSSVLGQQQAPEASGRADQADAAKDADGKPRERKHRPDHARVEAA